MPDPIFDRFTQDVTEEVSRMQPLPAEVRRRGNRLRRRNQALATVGAVAAVGVLAAPVAFLSDRSGPDGVDPADAPTSWVTTIPEGFDLTGGMPDNARTVDLHPEDPARFEEELSHVDALTQLHLCGSPDEAWQLEGASDAQAAASSNDFSEGGRQRMLAVYADESAATAVVAGIRDAVDACMATSARQKGWMYPTALDVRAGDESVAYIDQRWQAGAPADDGNLYLVVRVGNALVLDQAYTMGAADLALMQEGAESAAALLSPVVAEMEETFGDGEAPASPQEPVADDPDDPTSAAGSGGALRIPDDFPLDAGSLDLTGDGGEITGPARDIAGVGLATGPCGAAGLDVVPSVDRLAFTSTGPEATDVRELRVYASADHALDVVQQLRVAAGECTTDTTPQGGAIRWARFDDAATGWDSVSFGYTHEEGLGGSLFHVVRVGPAVLALRQDGEWSAASMGDGVSGLTAIADRIAPEMCVFTADGCPAG